MDAFTTSLYTLATVAVTELAQRVNKKDWNAVIKIVFAAAVGLAAGYLGLDGLNLLTGTVAGLAAVGIHTAASAAGGK